MELSSRVQYALLALLELSSHRLEGKPLKVTEIATIQSIPERYLDQILILLRRQGLVQSQRGMKGGYLLAKDPDCITLLEIVTALEGHTHPQLEPENSVLTIEKTAVLTIWQQAARACHSVLDSYTLQHLCEQREVSQQQDPMYYI